MLGNKNAPSGESLDHTFLGAFERRTAQQSASDNRQVDDVEHGHVASIHRRLCQVLDKGVDESLCHLSHLRPRLGRYHRCQGRCDNHQRQGIRNQGFGKSSGRNSACYPLAIFLHL